MEFRAEARYMRVSPQKARLVLDLIKGRRVEDAMNTLLFTKKGIAPTVHKLLRSAVENANYLNTEKGVEVDVDSLYVKRAIANDGPRMKRIRPAPMGRAFRYQRRMAHLEIALAERNGGSSNLASTVGGCFSLRSSAPLPARARLANLGRGMLRQRAWIRPSLSPWSITEARPESRFHPNLKSHVLPRRLNARGEFRLANTNVRWSSCSAQARGS